MPTVKAAVFFGGMAIKKDEEVLKKNCPHIVVGTPGRILALIRNKTLTLKNVKHFVLDECDKMLEQLGVLFCQIFTDISYFSSMYVYLVRAPTLLFSKNHLCDSDILLCNRYEA